MTKLSLALVLAIATTTLAQAPTPAALAQQAHDLAAKIGALEDVEEPTDEQKAQLAQKQMDLAAFVAMCVKGDGFGEQHFVEASSEGLLRRVASPTIEGDRSSSLGGDVHVQRQLLPTLRRRVPGR